MDPAEQAQGGQVNEPPDAAEAPVQDTTTSGTPATEITATPASGTPTPNDLTKEANRQYNRLQAKIRRLEAQGVNMEAIKSDVGTLHEENAIIIRALHKLGGIDPQEDVVDPVERILKPLNERRKPVPTPGDVLVRQLREAAEDAGIDPDSPETNEVLEPVAKRYGPQYMLDHMDELAEQVKAKGRKPVSAPAKPEPNKELEAAHVKIKELETKLGLRTVEAGGPSAAGGGVPSNLNRADLTRWMNSLPSTEYNKLKPEIDRAYARLEART